MGFVYDTHRIPNLFLLEYIDLFSAMEYHPTIIRKLGKNLKLLIAQLFGLMLLCLHVSISLVFSKENYTDAKTDAYNAIAKNDFRILSLRSIGPGFQAGVSCRQVHVTSKQIRYNFLAGANYASIRNQRDQDLIEYSANYNKIILMNKDYPDPDLCAPVKVCYQKRGKRETATNCEKLQALYRKPPGLPNSLHMAVRQKNVSKVKDILGGGFWNSMKFWKMFSEKSAKSIVNELDKKRRTAIDYAAENGSIEIVNLLIEHGAEIQPTYKLPEKDFFSRNENIQPKKNGMELIRPSPLYYAVHANNKDTSKVLISEGSIWFDTTNSMEMAATLNNNFDLIKLLLSAEESDKKTILGNSLYKATQVENFPLVKQLIKMGASPNYYREISIDHSKHYILSAALMKTDTQGGGNNIVGLEILGYLLNNGGDTNLSINTYSDKVSSLVCDAFYASQQDGLKVLLNHGANPLSPCIEEIITIANNPLHPKVKDRQIILKRLSNPIIRKALIDAGIQEARLPRISTTKQ